MGNEATDCARVIEPHQQTATAIRVVSVPRFKPSKVSIKTTPRKSTRAPHRFTTTGRVTLPSSVTKALGCTGTVAVTLHKGRVIFDSVADVPHSLYSEANASMEAIGEFDHADSEGFLRVLSVSARALAATGQVARPSQR